MCSPSATQLGQVGMMSSIVGGFSSTLGSVANAVNAKRTAGVNAGLAQQQVADAIARGRTAEFNSRLKTANLKSTQTARMAANGVALDSGSPLDVLTSTDVMGEQDALTIRNNAAREAYGYNVQAANYKAQAASANPFAAGVSTLLGSAGSVANNWYRYKMMSTGSGMDPWGPY